MLKHLKSAAVFLSSFVISLKSLRCSSCRQCVSLLAIFHSNLRSSENKFWWKNKFKHGISQAQYFLRNWVIKYATAIHQHQISFLHYVPGTVHTQLPTTRPHFYSLVYVLHNLRITCASSKLHNSKE